jgi:hypothetical protein
LLNLGHPPTVPRVEKNLAQIARDIMIPGNNFKPASLSEWLEIATKGIAAAGKERITREIEAHFAEAVEAHIAQGEPEPVAQAKAVIALGDATVAAKRFRRNHFTEEEVKSLEKMRKDAAKLRNFLLNVLYPLSFYSSCRLIFGDPKHDLYFIGLLSAAVALPGLSFVIANRPATKAKVSWLLLVEITTNVAFAAIAFPCIGGNSQDFSSAYWGIGAALLPITFRRLHLWNKARKLLFGAHDERVLSEPLPE